MIYNYTEKPLKIFGVPEFEKTKKLQRLSNAVMQEVPSLAGLGRRCPGARLCFRTDSPFFTVKIEFETLYVDPGMSLYSAQSAFVFIGERTHSQYVGCVFPPNYENKIFSRKFNKNETMEEVTVWLPRNERIANIEIEIADGAKIEEPTPYIYAKPILYYGSSITEGGCACNVSNAYNAIISRHLDVDYYNLGFSGNARGELPVADYIASLDLSLLVMDYDHNARTVEELRNTHESFFKRIREKQPNLPVLMLTRPAAKYGEEERKRKKVVWDTYANAVATGDENVYFQDGEAFFGDTDRELCTLDTIHPNDLGFYRMAAVLEPIINQILKNNRIICGAKQEL